MERSGPSDVARAGRAATALVVMGATGCNALSGVDDLVFAGAGATGSSSSAAASGAGGFGAASSSSASTGGASGASTGGWAASFGTAGEDEVRGVATDPNGDVWIAGTQDADVLFAKRGPDGAEVFTRIAGDGSAQRGMRVAANGRGAALLVDLEGTVDLGAGPRTAIEPKDILVGRFDAAGSLVWDKHLAGPGHQQGLDAALRGNGDVLVAGFTDAAFNADGVVISYSGGHDAAFAVLASADGKVVAANALGTVEDQVAYAVAALPTAGVLAGDFVGHMFETTLASQGQTDAFVARIEGEVEPWKHAWGNPELQTARGLAATESGDVAVVGAFQGVVDFGGCSQTSIGAHDAFVVRLAPDGSTIWCRSFGGPGEDTATAVALGAAGEVVVAGIFSGTLAADARSLESAGGEDAFVLVLDSSGSVVQAVGLGGPLRDTAESVALAVGGGIVVGGSFQGEAKVGSALLSSVGGTDGFVVVLAP